MTKLITLLGITLACTTLLFSPRPAAAQAQPGDAFNCDPEINFSQSPGYTSADPLLLADPSGMVHLFWVERITGAPDEPPNMPDALMYATWNGDTWSKPIDLFLSPREYVNKRVGAVRGIIDDSGTIHLLWIGPDNTLFYSFAHASQAEQATAWHPPQIIAYDHVGTQYSADVAFMPPNTLHMVYGRDPDESKNQMLVHIKSTDGGQSWTEPQTIYTVPYTDRGTSNIRLWVDAPDRIYTTWTEWDTTGTGQVIYFARSLDNGSTWEKPVMLAERKGNEYERNWVTVALLGDNELVTFWEGGWRAYRQAQYSHDGGVTWSQPKDTLDWLIADSGFAEFIRDGADRLHLFVIQRVREGNPDRDPYVDRSNGLWHSVWEGGTNWRQPDMVGQPNRASFNTVAIRGGNELIAATFGFTESELFITRCQLYDTPSIPFVPWTEIPALPAITATQAP
ncbi:MAG: exo-alpha-sialidase, partial [Anaerolineae bacterium]|nr:exo-alpha-sialidase [Anaerolineae bacterium]